MTAKPRTRKFQAETRKLLDLMIHSVYSRKDVFLRELISNASDAIDKVRFLALTDPALADEAQDFKIKLIPDAAAGTLAVQDNGIGMDEEDVTRNLGTIARSGSAEFLAGLRAEAAAADNVAANGDGGSDDITGTAGDGAADTDLIGQFGVGFYSVFMVADKVVVESQKHGADHAVRWVSTGGESYTIETLPPRARGTTVTLHLKREADPHAGEDDAFGLEAPAEAFTDTWTLRRIVKQHSDFIAFPIVMDAEREEREDGAGEDQAGAGEDADGAEGAKSGPRTRTVEETINSMRPLWTRARDEVSEDEYHEFYRHITHDWQDPFEVIHAHIEGMHEYTTLMYIPGRAPVDLYTREHRRGLQLYAKRVFIMEECRELLPEYLRFVRGLVDSPDLPLNISREMVQQDRLILTIRKHLTRRLLDALRQRLESDRAAYEGFWAEFGPVVKEGFHYEPAQADTLKALVLFRSTAGEGWTTLAEYAARMPEGQDAVYYLTGESRELARNAPQIEAFRAKGIEVLLLTDAVDEIVALQLGDYEGNPLTSVSRGEIDLAGVKASGEGEASADGDEGAADADGGPVPEALGPLLGDMQTFLADDIESVRVSKRLTDSAVCVVSPEGGLSPQIEQMMRAMGQDLPRQKRVLEVNPKHPLITRLYAIHQVNPDDPRLREGAEMLLDQALLAEGAAIKNPARFAQRVAELMAKAM